LPCSRKGEPIAEAPFVVKTFGGCIDDDAEDDDSMLQGDGGTLDNTVTFYGRD
jgi:hypothetical protein